MKSQIEEAMGQIVQSQGKELESLQSAYPIVLDLCTRITNTIDRCLTGVNQDQKSEQWFAEMQQISKAISDEPNGLRMRAAEMRGFIKGCAATAAHAGEVISSQSRFEEKVEDLAEKIESGEIDPSAKRNVGERPESLKTLRSAMSKVSGSNT